MKSISVTVVCVALVLVGWVHPASGQNVTTGTITGVVSDQQGGVLPGATVTAVHEPTGTSYEGVTQGDGRFSLLNVRVGGPYQVVVALPGFRSGDGRGRHRHAWRINRTAGHTAARRPSPRSCRSPPSRFPVFTASKAGHAGQHRDGSHRDAPDDQPQHAGLRADLARTSIRSRQATSPPRSRWPAATRDTTTSRSTARSTTTCSASPPRPGHPGGSAETQPISFDVIQELQLVVSPYDVRQGMFSGGGINAITRSGTNEIRGLRVLRLPRSEPGRRRHRQPTDRDVQRQAVRRHARRTDRAQPGVLPRQPRVGPQGHAVRLLGLRYVRRRVRPPGRGPAHPRHRMHALRVQPGGLDEFIRGTDNNKVFVRTDFNLGNSQLTVRHNYVDGFNDVGSQYNITYKFPDNFYTQHSQTNSTVGQLNSSFGSNVQRVPRHLSAHPRLPHVRHRASLRSRCGCPTAADSTSAPKTRRTPTSSIRTSSSSPTTRRWCAAGTPTRFGTHNEFFKFRNLFIQNNFGNYEFASIDNFAAGIAQGYRLQLLARPATRSRPRSSTCISSVSTSATSGGCGRISRSPTACAGTSRSSRTSRPPTLQPSRTTATRTDVVPSPQQWSPRVGFNLDLSRDKTRQQVRGGVGLFSGRNPFVYLSNQYGNTGIEFRRLSLAVQRQQQRRVLARPRQPAEERSATPAPTRST